MREQADARLTTAWRWAAPVAVAVLVGFLLVDPVPRSDLTVFLRAANDVARGRNPYTPVSDPFLWHGSAYVYPYLTAFLFVPLTWVPVAVADVLWFLIGAAAVGGGCWALRLRDPLGIAAILLSATCVRGFQVGSINALLFFGLALMWRFRDRIAALAVSFALVAGAKLFLLPMAFWIALTRSRRAAIAAALALGCFLGVGVIAEPITPTTFYRSTSTLADHEGPGSMSVLRWAANLFPVDQAKALALVIGLIVILGAARWNARHPEGSSAVLFCACVIGSLLATPIYWSHYTLLVAVPVLLASPTRRAAGWFCLATWVVSPPVLTWHIWQLPMPGRLLALYALMAVALWQVARPNVVARRPVLTP